MRRCGADEIAPLFGRAVGSRGPHLVPPLGRGQVDARVHAVVRLRDGGGAPIRDAGNDRSPGEDLRIGREHHRGHRAAGRQSCGVDPAGVESVVGLHLVDHLLDRQRLARLAGGVADLEEVEAAVDVVDALLLRQQQCEAPLVGQFGPTRLIVEGGRGLRASMHRHDQRPAGRKAVGHVPEHLQVTGVRTERGHLLQGGRVRRRVEPEEGGALRPPRGRPLAYGNSAFVDSCKS